MPAGSDQLVHLLVGQVRDAMVLDACGGKGREPPPSTSPGHCVDGPGASVLDAGKPRFTSYWLCDLEQVTSFPCALSPFSINQVW